MSLKILIRSDIKYLLFSEVYLRAEPKSRRRALALVEAAISCFAKSGFENVSLEMIAREAGVSRTLLNHYFSDANEIREISIKYIRLCFQKIAVEALAKGSDPKEMLASYVDACFFWLKNFRKHALVWLSFLHRCANLKTFRALNTKAVDVGHQRIMTVLEMGQQAGIFTFKDCQQSAKTIQSLICGALVSIVSEDMPDPKSYTTLIRLQCLALVGVKTL